jgi:hypothetical protein
LVNAKINKAEPVESVEPAEPAQHWLTMNISLLLATSNDLHFHAKV